MPPWNWGQAGDARTGEPFIFCPELSQSPLSSFYPENVRLIGARKKYEEEGRIDRMEHLAVEKWTDGVTMIFGFRIHSLAHSLTRMDEKWDGVIVMYPIC